MWNVAKILKSLMTTYEFQQHFCFKWPRNINQLYLWDNLKNYQTSFFCLHDFILNSWEELIRTFDRCISFQINNIIFQAERTRKKICISDWKNNRCRFIKTCTFEGPPIRTIWSWKLERYYFYYELHKRQCIKNSLEK